MEIYFQNRSSVRETYGALCPFYGRHNRPSEQAIRSVMYKFFTTYSLHDVRPPTRYPLKLTVWCGVHANGIIGPYFFRNKEAAVVTVNGVRYLHTLHTFLFPEMQELNIGISWFPQDDATYYTDT